MVNVVVILLDLSIKKNKNSTLTEQSLIYLARLRDGQPRTHGFIPGGSKDLKLL